MKKACFFTVAAVAMGALAAEGIAAPKKGQETRPEARAVSPFMAGIREAEIKVELSTLEEVHAAYLEALKTEPQNPVGKYLAAYTNPEREAAEEFFREALQNADDKSPYHLGMGMIFYEWKVNDRAVLSLDKAVEADPLNYVAWYYKGKYHMRREEYPEAIAALEKSRAIDPSFALSQVAAGFTYLAMKDSDKAMAAFGEAVRIEPRLFEPHYQMALLLDEKGKPDEAAAEYVKASELAPGNPDVQLKLAAVFEKSGRLREAIDAYERAGKQKQSDSEIFVSIAKLASKLGDKDEEYRGWERAVKAKPENADAQISLGWMALDRKEFDRAEKAFLEAARRKLDDHMIYIGLGRANAGKGELRKAMDHYRRAIRIESASKEAKAELAAIQKKLDVTTEKYEGKTPQQTYQMFLQKVSRNYKQFLKKFPGLRGSVIVVITVDAGGGVKEVYLDQSTLKNPDLETCIYGNALMAQFPPGGEGTKYRFPLKLSPGSQ
jgi:tetratricopeptide (TPR) repeat protein